MDHLQIKKLRHDPDALIAYGIALAVVLFSILAPDALWQRALDRLGYIVTAVGLPAIVTAGRFFVRGRAATAQGEVAAADVRRSGLAAMTMNFAGSVDEPAGVTKAQAN